MRRIFLLIVVAGLSTATPLFAQSRPHMELVQGLRSNGLADLALTYLDELKASNPPPDIVVVLPLEYARTRLALARMETDEAKRNHILAQATTEFDTFIKSNPTHPQTPYANIDVARLNGLRAKTLYSKARWIQDEKAKAAKMTAARTLYMEATKKYASTIAAIEKQANKTPELESLELGAKLDQAINLYDSAQTYDDSSEQGVKRGDDLEAAKKILQKITLLDKDPIAWVARAWLAQITYDLGDSIAAKAELDNIIVKHRNDPKAQAGIRIAQYWRIFQNDKVSKTPQGEIQRNIDDASAWLSNYRSYQNTPEGMGRSSKRATKRKTLAMYGVIYDKVNKSKIVSITPTAIKHLEEAEKDFKKLIDSDNEYSEQSTIFRNQILVALFDQVERGAGEIDPAALGSFEKCYLAVQVQIARMYQFSQKKPAPSDKEFDAEQKRRYTKAIEFLEFALAHVAPSDSVKDVFNAQLTLITYYFRQHFYQQAAVLAEYVARTNPRAAKAAMVAGFAMDCYGQAYSHDKGKAGMTPEALDTDLERRREIARYIVSTWPDAPTTDFSRHILAQQFAREDKFENAMQLYQTIKPGYGNLTSVCLEMSGTMFKMVKPVGENDPVQFYAKAKDNIAKHKVIWDKTIQMLTSLPAPTEESVNSVIEDTQAKSMARKGTPATEQEVGAAVAAAVNPYFSTQSNLALLYQLQGRTEDAKKLGERLLELIGKLPKLQEEAKELHTFKAKTIIYKALANECVDFSKQKNYAKVAETLDPLIAKMEADFNAKKSEASEPPKDFRDSQRQVLVIALQSAVQDGKIARAGDLLSVLEKSGGSTEGNFGMIRSLAGTIRGQLEGLREELRKNPKDNEKKLEIDNLTKGFTEFLNQIAPKADLIKDEAGKIEMKIFLAQGYSSVDSYAEATKLLKPVRDSLKTMKIPAEQKDAMERKKKQVDYALLHNLRLGKKYDDAEAVFKEVIGPDPKKGAAIPVASRGWGYSVPMVRKERALLKEEVALNWTSVKPSKAAKWKEAFDEWAEIKKAFAGNIPPRVDENSPTIIKPVHFMFFTGGCVVTTNPIQITLRDIIRGKIETANRKRSTFFDIFLDQAHCFLKAYHALDPVKYEPQIAKIAHSMAEFHAKNSDLSPEHLERIKAIVEQYPKTFGPKYRAEDAELSPNPKSKSK